MDDRRSSELVHGVHLRGRVRLGTLAESRIASAAAATSTDHEIAARGIVKTYNTAAIEVPALRGVDFAVTRGEMVAVMGPSGCGKTTLLNCLSGLDDVDSGTVFIEGENLAAMGDKKRTNYRARRMGFIFQVYNLLPVLTAVENIELPLLVSNVRPGEARKRALEALERVGLADWAGHRPAELSGGQRQRVAIARALANRPAIVWADEPTGALDWATAMEILHLLRELNAQAELTLVLVTHDPEVGAQCDRTVRMQDGVVVGDERPERRPPAMTNMTHVVAMGGADG